MAFQLKNYRSIVAAMINHLRGVQTDVTDFNVGSVARTMLEAPAIELDQLYQQFFNGVKEAIPVATYNSFSFAKIAAVAAAGVVRVNIAASGADVVVPAGTVFTTQDSARVYVTFSPVTILAGNTAGDVLAVAQVPGAVGNMPASTPLNISPVPAGFVSASNLAAFLNGKDEESDEERKQRFVLYVTTLQRGTVAALEYGAKTAALYDGLGVEIERVKSVSVVEPYLIDPINPPGYVEVYIHNGVGATSDALLARTVTVLHGYIDDATATRIPGWKAAGVHVDVFKAEEVELDITAELTPELGYDGTVLVAAAEAVLSEYLQSLDISQTFIEAEAIYRIKSIPGVSNITGIPSDLDADGSEKIIPGAITITVAP